MKKNSLLSIVLVLVGILTIRYCVTSHNNQSSIFGGPTSQSTTPDTATQETAVSDEQTAYFNAHGKYKQDALQVVDGKGTTKKVNEYIAPTGAGYEVVFTNTQNGCEQTKVVATGPEGKARSHDWNVCPPPFVSSTSTTP